MRMSDKELKRVLQEAVDYDADCIMAEVNSDPEMQDVVAPDDMYDNVMNMIREHEKKKQTPSSNLTGDQTELIRLGKKYRKNSGKGKYIILVAAIVCALGVGTISFGDNEKVVQKVKDMMDGKEQVLVDGDGRTEEIKEVGEEEAYSLIEEKFGFKAVRMHYLPQRMKFIESVIEEESQNARLYYENSDEGTIRYSVVTGHRAGSIGFDIEDKFIEEYEREVEGVSVKIKEYLVEENNTKRWSVTFDYQDAQYWLLLSGLEEKEVEQIIEKLYFM